jgi:hypothetical protein
MRSIWHSTAKFAWGPVRATVRLVRVDGVPLDKQVRDPVGPGQHQRRHRGDARPRAGESAGVEVDPTLLGRDAAVLGHAGPELDGGRLPRIAGGQLLLGGRHDLDRPPRPPGQERGDVLDADAQLPTESTPDARHNHADLRGRDLEDLGQRVLDLERQLRVRPDRHLPGAVPLGHRRAGLRVPLVHHAGREAVLEDAIGLGEAALDVAHHDPGAIADVAFTVEYRDGRVGGPVLVDQGGARRQRGRDVQHRW